MDNTTDADGTHDANERPRGVSKTKLVDMNLDHKLPIFYRPRHNTPLVPLEQNLPKAAAIAFCDRIRSDVLDNNSRAYTVTGGNEAAYKSIFAWIMECVGTQSIVKFPDIPEPEANPFLPTIEIVLAGDQLGIPAGSLSYFLKKRLLNIARKHLIPLDQVPNFYTTNSRHYKAGLKEVACLSIFNAWWDARLDETTSSTAMEELSDLRATFPELDDDLHVAFETRKAEVEAKWEQKKARREAEKHENAADSGGNTLEDTVVEHNPIRDATVWTNDSTNGTDVWTSTGIASELVLDQETKDTKPDAYSEAPQEESCNCHHGTTSTGKQVFKVKTSKVADSDSGDWADEMNDHQTMQQDSLPPIIQSIPSTGW